MFSSKTTGVFSVVPVENRKQNIYSPLRSLLVFHSKPGGLAPISFNTFTSIGCSCTPAL